MMVRDRRHGRRTRRTPAQALVEAGPWLYDKADAHMAAQGAPLALGTGGVYTGWFQFSKTRDSVLHHARKPVILVPEASVRADHDVLVAYDGSSAALGTAYSASVVVTGLPSSS